MSVESLDYFVKWNGLPYSEATWEASHLIARCYQSKIDQYYTRIESQKIPTKLAYTLKRRPKFSQIKEQPSYFGSEELILRDYQLEGLNWLAHAWCK